MKNSIRNTLIALTAAVGISTTVHVLSESYRDKVVAVLAHDGKVALGEKETFLNSQPNSTDTKNIFLAIKSTNTVIEGIIRNHLGDNAIIDDSIQEELNSIYRDLVGANTIEELTDIHDRLTAVLNKLSQTAQDETEKNKKKIQDGLSTISKGDIDSTQLYITECLKIADSSLTTPAGQKIDFNLAENEEMIGKIRLFSVEKDHEKASVYLRDIIHNLEEHISNNKASELSAVHLAEIAARLDDRDSMGELIVKYGAYTLLIAIALLAFYGSAELAEVHLRAMKRTTGKTLGQRNRDRLTHAKNHVSNKAQEYWSIFQLKRKSLREKREKNAIIKNERKEIINAQKLDQRLATIMSERGKIENDIQLLGPTITARKIELEDKLKIINAKEEAIRKEVEGKIQVMKNRMENIVRTIEDLETSNPDKLGGMSANDYITNNFPNLESEISSITADTTAEDATQLAHKNMDLFRKLNLF